jgi:hypothetical protein
MLEVIQSSFLRIACILRGLPLGISLKTNIVEYKNILASNEAQHTLNCNNLMSDL